MQTQIKFLLFSVKLIGYNFSAVDVVPSNPCVGHSPRIKIYFFLLSTCTEELYSKNYTVSTNPLPTETVPFLSNPIPYLEYLH